MNEGVAKALLTLVISNGIFDLPKLLIDLFESSYEFGVNVELEIVECGVESFQFFSNIVQSLAVKVLCFDLEDGDLVNEFSQRDRGKNVLEWLWLDCILRSFQCLARCSADFEMLLQCFNHPFQHFIPIPSLLLAEETHRGIPEGGVAF